MLLQLDVMVPLASLGGGNGSRFRLNRMVDAPDYMEIAPYGDRATGVI
ncbi:MAG: hypothetical protein WDN49_10335 [Acetobacteraceae bacterium]